MSEPMTSMELQRIVYKGHVVSGTVYMTAVPYPDGQNYLCYLLADDGECLGTHICSSPDWMRHDLTQTGSRKGTLEGHFGGKEGEAYEVIDLGTNPPPSDVIERNRALGEERRKEAGEHDAV